MSFFKNITYKVNQGDVSLFNSSPLWVKLACLNTIYDKRGVIESFVEQKPLKNNTPQPLLTFSFIDWLESFSFLDWKLVEIGSGNSTLYFAQKFKTVISYETDYIFYNELKESLPDNVDYRYIGDSILKGEKFDNINFDSHTLVLVDSATSRSDVVKNLISKNIPSIIVLDNSDIFPNIVSYICNSGYTEIPFWGLKLTEHFESCTSVFVKDISALPQSRLQYHSAGSRHFQSELDIV